LLGTLLVFSVSALILNALLYRSRLVPAWLSLWGLAGALLLLTNAVPEVFSVEAPFPLQLAGCSDPRAGDGPGSSADLETVHGSAGAGRARRAEIDVGALIWVCLSCDARLWKPRRRQQDPGPSGRFSGGWSCAWGRVGAAGWSGRAG
jgi:Domain of unknown function (DUF4386)